MTVRTCTRCRDANGVPTGVVLGGECFLCHGKGTFTRETVSRAVREAGSRRMAAINMLRNAGMTRRAAAARCELEETEPARHDRLIESVLKGRIGDVLNALTSYAAEHRIY